MTNTCASGWVEFTGEGPEPAPLLRLPGGVVSVEVVSVGVAPLTAGAEELAAAGVASATPGAGAGAAGTAAAGAVPGGGDTVAPGVDGSLRTATRWRSAASVVYGTVGVLPRTWMITPVARAEAAATIASCGQVRRIDRSRRITVR